MDRIADIEFVRRTDRIQEPSLTELGEDFSRWLVSTNVSKPVHAFVMSATHEAVSNAAQHAYRGGSGPIGIHATLQRSCGRLTVLVSDQGRWQIPDARRKEAGSGGLQLIERITTASAVRPTATGTTVSMAWEM